jgi:hypothetical protein
MLNWLADSTAWGRYVAAAEVIGGFATGLGILIGGVSLLMILFQARHSARVSNHLSALEAQKDYIRLCVDYPELSSSFMMSKSLNLSSFSGFLNILTPESERALWFLSYVLFAMEQSIVTYVRWAAIDPCWRKNVEDQLGYHAELLEDVWPAWKLQYSAEMDRAVQSVLGRQFTGSEVDIGRPFARPSPIT